MCEGTSGGDDLRDSVMSGISPPLPLPGLPRTSGSHPNAGEARPKPLAQGSEAAARLRARVCVRTSVRPHRTLSPDNCAHECICSCLSICESARAHARPCQKLIQDEAEMLSRGKAQLGLIAQNSASISSSTIASELLVASITGTSYAPKRNNTTKVEINNRTRLL